MAHIDTIFKLLAHTRQGVCQERNGFRIGRSRIENVFIINRLTPSDHYMGRTAQLTSRCCISCIYSTNIRNEYFKHAA